MTTTTALPSTMRAITHSQLTNTLTLHSTSPAPHPNLTATEHLIRVHTVALTRQELLWPRPPPLNESYSPGVECCGVVALAPPRSKFPVGTRVYMRTTYPRDANLREYTIGLEAELARVPDGLSDEEASAVPVSALTGWQGLFVHGGVAEPGSAAVQGEGAGGKKRRVLVNGAAGSVGSWYVQLAVAAGSVDVVGTCGTKDVERVRGWGCAEVIDYTTTNLREYKGDKFDLVLDCVGGKSLEDCWFVATPDKSLVLSIVPPADMKWKWVLDRPEGASEGMEGRFFVMESSGADLEKVGRLIEAGKVMATVDSVWGFEEFETAFERVDGGRARGKVVVRVAEGV